MNTLPPAGVHPLYTTNPSIPLPYLISRSLTKKFVRHGLFKLMHQQPHQPNPPVSCISASTTRICLFPHKCNRQHEMARVGDRAIYFGDRCRFGGEQVAGCQRRCESEELGSPRYRMIWVAVRARQSHNLPSLLTFASLFVFVLRKISTNPGQPTSAYMR